MLLTPLGFFIMQTFFIWVNFTLRISPKTHYSFFFFFPQGSALLNARCDDNWKICNIISQNFKIQCDLQVNGNRIWIKTGSVTLKFDILDSGFWQPDLATQVGHNWRLFSDKGEGQFYINNRPMLSDTQCLIGGRQREGRGLKAVTQGMTVEACPSWWHSPMLLNYEWWEASSNQHPLK